MCSQPLDLDLGVTSLDDPALNAFTAALASRWQADPQALLPSHNRDPTGGPVEDAPAPSSSEVASCAEQDAPGAEVHHTAAMLSASAPQDSSPGDVHVPDQRPLSALHIDSCSRLTRASIGGLAETHLLRGLRALNLSGLPCLGSGPCSPAACSAAAGTLSHLLGHAKQLQVVFLDELALSERVCDVIASSCGSLQRASLMACKGLTDAGLGRIAQGCLHLQDLTIGGAASPWSESKGLAALTQLTQLHLARRPACTDAAFQACMGSFGQLQVLRLASLSRITDAGLAAVPLGVTALTLVCCDNVRGASLARLCRLRELRMRHCPAVTPQQLQVSAGCWKKALALDAHMQ